MMDRRELLHRAAALLGATLSSGTVAGVLAGCVSTPGSGDDARTFFTPDEMKTATALADQILPRTDTPGAVDAGVPAFMDRMLAGYYQDRERGVVRAGLQRADQDARSAHGLAFASLTPDQQVALMKTWDAEAYPSTRANANNANAPPHFFRLMKELTIVGFCTSEAGATKFLNYAAIPGPYQADVPYSQVGKAWQS